MKLNLSLCAFVALGAACASDTDDRPVSFNYIHAAILKPNCATSGCHSTLTKTRGVDLQDRDSALLVFRLSGLGDLDAGVMYKDIPLLLKGGAGQFYRMPPDQPLPNADIDLIERWFIAGKLDN
jgi:hypothetical protein